MPIPDGRPKKVGSSQPRLEQNSHSDKNETMKRACAASVSSVPAESQRGGLAGRGNLADTGAKVKNNIISDLEAYGYRQRDIEQARARATNAANELSLFLDYLKAGGRKGLLEDKLALRAVKIAFHTDGNGLKKMFQETGPTGNRVDIEAEIDRVVTRSQTYSARLTALRLHHQLTMLQIAGYKDLARELAYCRQ